MTASAIFNSENVTSGVSWALVGSSAAGTSITGSGANATLTVAANEGNTVTVRVSHQGSNGSGGGATGATNGITKDVTVTVLNSSPAANVAVGGEFTDDKGVVWKVLAKEGNKSLVTTKYVYGYGTQYNTTAVWNHLDTSGNNLKSTLQTWYTNTAGTDIKDSAVPYVRPLPDVRSAGGNWNNAENDPAGYSHPAASGTATANGSNAIFVLSISEANQYLGSAAAGKIAYDASSTSTARNWWLRSPGGAAIAGYVSTGGSVGTAYATGTSFGFRPALWVES
jgi:hypothetical protein